MEHSKNNSTQTHWPSVISSILLAKAAVATFSIAPFLIGSYIDHVGLSAQKASQVLSAEIFALAISNIIAFFWIHKANCRIVSQAFLVAVVALNLLCITSSSFSELLSFRILIGFCEGSLLALGFGLLSNSARPDRNFGLYFGISLSVGALNVRLLPLFLENAGITGLFINLSLYAAIAFLGSFWVQKGSFNSTQTQNSSHKTDDKKSTATTIAFPILLLGFLMLANYIYFVGQGGVWSFLERIGLQYSINLEGIAEALSLSLIAGVLGGFSAGWLDVKLGRVIPLVTAIALAVISVIILMVSHNAVAFTIAVFLFNFGNNFGHPYVLGFASQIDKSARLTVLSGAMHTGGQATGPLIVGLVVSQSDYTNALTVGLAAFIVSVLVFLPVMLRARALRQ